MDTKQRGRTENETQLYMYLIEKLGRIYEGCIFKKEWAFEFGHRETPDCYCFVIRAEYKGDPDDRVTTETTSHVSIVIATEDNIDLLTSKGNGLMTEFAAKPEIVVVMRADRPQVDTWTLVSKEARHLTRNDYRHTTRNDGGVEFDALGGDFHWFFDDVYEDCKGIYEQVAA